MGFANREGGKFFNIYNGKFAIRVPEGTAGAVRRENKEKKIVHEIFHDSFEAKLVGIRTQDSPYGKNWLFDFNSDGEAYTLQLSYSNSFAKNFLKILPNADLTKEMKVQPSQKMEGDKKKTSLFVSQDGVTLKHAYTKDNPNGLPPMEQVTIKGQQMWDDTKQLEFLHEMVISTIVPKLPKQEAVTPSQEALAVEGGEGVSDENDF